MPQNVAKRVGQKRSHPKNSCSVIILTLLPLISGPTALAQSAQGILYHPCRTIHATNYQLGPLYQWLSHDNPWRQQHPRPLPKWTATLEGRYNVHEIFSDNALLLDHITSANTGLNTNQLILIHYPGADTMTDGTLLRFIAMETGRYRWTNHLAGTIHTLPLYDYGIPCEPPTKRQQEKYH